jgi:hypothetical protein
MLQYIQLTTLENIQFCHRGRLINNFVYETIYLFLGGRGMYRSEERTLLEYYTKTTCVRIT